MYLQFLEAFAMETPDLVAPCRDGKTISMEWCRNGWDYEVEIMPDVKNERQVLGSIILEQVT